MIEIVSEIKGVGRVVRCRQCEDLHLQIGPVTLQMSLADFQSTFEMMKVAVHKLVREQDNDHPGYVSFTDGVPRFRSIM